MNPNRTQALAAAEPGSKVDLKFDVELGHCEKSVRRGPNDSICARRLGGATRCLRFG
jgi:hypothetical protein